ncbi:hypothetical protein V5799_007306 [Amblyomma americanum]|uniref:Uncharacterized protein n=1 Tax=Amblyomma americanum TaxID=6943 RepID=A0AAQ4DTX3_AMBAM
MLQMAHAPLIIGSGTGTSVPSAPDRAVSSPRELRRKQKARQAPAGRRPSTSTRALHWRLWCSGQDTGSLGQEQPLPACLACFYRRGRIPREREEDCDKRKAVPFLFGELARSPTTRTRTPDFFFRAEGGRRGACSVRRQPPGRACSVGQSRSESATERMRMVSLCRTQ